MIKHLPLSDALSARKLTACNVKLAANGVNMHSRSAVLLPGSIQQVHAPLLVTQVREMKACEPMMPEKRCFNLCLPNLVWLVA